MLVTGSETVTVSPGSALLFGRPQLSLVIVADPPLRNATPVTQMFAVADPPAELPQGAPAEAEISLAVRVANLTAVILPLAAVVLGMVSLWGRGFTWIDFTLLSSMYALTVLGITVGFHRFFTHRSFEAHGAVAFVLGVLGSMAVQGRLFNWVALHRRHHQHSDATGDPIISKL